MARKTRDEIFDTFVRWVKTGCLIERPGVAPTGAAEVVFGRALGASAGTDIIVRFPQSDWKAELPLDQLVRLYTLPPG
jgi:hypothetical protein